MRYVRRDRVAAVLVTACALSLGACAHHEETAARRYGSIKDDPIVTGSVSKPSRVAPGRIRKVAVAKRIEKVAAPPLEVIERAPQAPAPGITRPSPPRTAAPAPSPVSTSTATPAPSPGAEPPLPPVDEPAAVAEMLAEGLALFDQGKVTQARRRFVAAMNGPVPEVLLALARSYDTYYLSRLPTSDGAPDMQRALILYERALERGAGEAAPDLERTRGILKIPR